MAVDKLVDSTQLDADLTSVANAIRTKGGTSSQLAFPAGFVSAVQAIPTGVTPTGTKNISITQNGTTTEDVTAYASAMITANVPNTYAAADEGKVVDDGALVAQTSRNIDTNGTYDTTTNNEVVVNVSGGGSGVDIFDFTGGNILAIVAHSSEYIVTDILPPFENSIFSGKFKDVNANNYEHYFSCSNASNRVRGLQRQAYNWVLLWNIGTTTAASFTNADYTNKEIFVSACASTLYSSGTSYATKPLTIFAGYYNGAIENTKSSSTFYGVNIISTSGNEESYFCKLVPWLDNGTVGVKDLVTGNFYGNSGSGAFDYIDLEGVLHSA